MALPTKQKLWILRGEKKNMDEWEMVEGDLPKLTARGVLVKLHAAALNYREILLPTGGYPFAKKFPVIGGSDGAGEVLDVGPEVRKWAKGDRVATIFNPGHQDGALWGEAFRMGALGATIDETFQEYGVYDEDWLVRVASNLSYLEGASLSNAAVTAWNALYGLKPIKPGSWVLVQGTVGVSLFALQFAKAGGANVVATTSSAEKAKLLKDHGADHVLNYRDIPEWGETAKRLTAHHEGFDQIVEIGGGDTMTQSINAVRKEDIITLIGVVTGLEARFNALEALYRIFTMRGINVGSKAQFQDMMDAMEANDIHPIIDKKKFGLADLPKALEYLEAQRHVGKVVLQIV